MCSAQGVGHFFQHGRSSRIHVEQRINAGALKLRECLSKPFEKSLRGFVLSVRACQSLNPNPGLTHGFLKCVDPQFAYRTVLRLQNVVAGL